MKTPGGCTVRGPYHPIGRIEWECDEHGISVEGETRATVRCVVTEPDPRPTPALEAPCADAREDSTVQDAAAVKTSSLRDDEWNQRYSDAVESTSGATIGAEVIAQVRAVARAELAELRAEVERLGRQLSTAHADVQHWRSSFDDMKAEGGRLHEDGLRARELHALARAADAATIAAAEQAQADERAGLAAVIARWESDRDTCLAWIADPAMHVDEGHVTRLSDKADMLNRHAQEIRAVVNLTDL